MHAQWVQKLPLGFDVNWSTKQIKSDKGDRIGCPVSHLKSLNSIIHTHQWLGLILFDPAGLGDGLIWSSYLQYANKIVYNEKFYIKVCAKTCCLAIFQKKCLLRIKTRCPFHYIQLKTTAPLFNNVLTFSCKISAFSCAFSFFMMAASHLRSSFWTVRSYCSSFLGS